MLSSLNTQSSLARCGSVHGAWIGAVAFVSIALVLVVAFVSGSKRTSESVSPNEASVQPKLEARTTALEAAAPSTSNDRHAADDATNPKFASAIVLQVRTVDSTQPQGKPLGGLALDIGIDLPKSPNPPVLVHLTTDPNGKALIVIPEATVRAARSRGVHHFWVRVASPGYQDRTLLRAFPDDLSPVSMTITATRGVTLRGRVLDANGAPASAIVRAARREGADNDVVATGGEVTSDGWFEIVPEKSGMYELTADGGALGTASIRDLNVFFDQSPAPLEMRLRGAGVVRGHVHDAHGRPCGGIDLMIRSAEIDDAASALREQRGIELTLEGRGRASVVLKTDANGAFEVRGLRDDRFNVLTLLNRRRGDAARDLLPLLLTRAPVSSNGADLDLVFDPPRIAVHVVNADGTPWRGGCREGWAPYPDASSWWDAPKLALEPMPSDVRIGPWDGLDIFGRRLNDGEFEFDVPVARHYLVGLRGRGQAWDPVEVSVPADAGRVDVEIIARPTAVGTVSLSVFDRFGDPMQDVMLVVQIEDAKHGIPLGSDRARRSAWPMNVELPEGVYRIVVEDVVVYPNTETLPPQRASRRAHGRFEATVHVEKDRETALRADLPAGARLHLKLTGEEKPEDLAALKARESDGTRPEEYAKFATISLLADNRWPQPVYFEYPVTGSELGRFLSALPLGTEDTSALISSGHFRLEARMPGGRVVSRDVVLVDGQTTDVTLRFD